MNELSKISIIILFAAIILSKIISEKALKQLSPEQKISILDSFSKMRMYNLIPLVLILGFFFFAEKIFHFNGFIPYILFLVAILSFMMVIQVVSLKKLKTLQLPDKYMKKYFSSQLIILLGFIAWIGISIFPLISSGG
jgi:hypothetical protein